jgi:hypothetical protein
LNTFVFYNIVYFEYVVHIFHIWNWKITILFVGTITHLQHHKKLQMINKIFIWGSKWHITSQCVYFAFRTIILFGVLFPKKCVFLKKNFQMKCFLKIIYFIYNFPICQMFFYNQIWRNMIFLKVHRFCQILCFILKICHNSNHIKTC